MSKAEAQYLFNTLEGYEHFIASLLDHGNEDANPILDWKDAILNNNLLFD